MFIDTKREGEVIAPAEDGWRSLLRRAAQLIRDRGHCKGSYEKNGALCAVGALSMAATGHYEPDLGNKQYCAAMGKIISAQINRRVYFLPEWNDRPETTAEDVAGFFERVAYGD